MTPSNRRLTLCLATWLVMTIVTAPARADSLSTTNQSTLARSFALPAVGHSAPVKSSRLTGSIDLTSEFVDKQEANEAILLDGETQRYALRFDQALGARADWSLEVPLLHTGGGFMDGPIENWHDLFGLPQGGPNSGIRAA